MEQELNNNTSPNPDISFNIAPVNNSIEGETNVDNKETVIVKMVLSDEPKIKMIGLQDNESLEQIPCTSYESRQNENLVHKTVEADTQGCHFHDLVSNKLISNFHCQIIKKFEISKKNKMIYKTLFYFGDGCIVLQEWGSSILKDFNKYDMVQLNKFLIRLDPEIGSQFQIKCNDKQFILDKTSISNVELSMVQFNEKAVMQIAEILALNDKEYRLISVKCLVKDFQIINFKGKLYHKFKAFDTKNQMDFINVNFWNSETTLINGNECILEHVILKKLNGFVINDCHFTEIGILLESEPQNNEITHLNDILPSDSISVIKYWNEANDLAANSEFSLIGTINDATCKNNAVYLLIQDENNVAKLCSIWNKDCAQPLVRKETLELIHLDLVDLIGTIVSLKIIKKVNNDKVYFNLLSVMTIPTMNI